ncbi:MAG: ATP-binding protein [Ilumatobacteraceae bacterium]
MTTCWRRSDQDDDQRRCGRIVEAKFPRIKRLADFDVSAAPAVQPATLAAGNYLTTGEKVVLLDDSGTGKSHLLIGLETGTDSYRLRTTRAKRSRSSH